jgi:hypothetical protein
MTLYARRITLRNCGRFTVIQSDFGGDYRTHTHVTSEALYASMTRGVTWQAQPINLKQDRYSFFEDYDVEKLPIWFLPAVFHTQTSEVLTDDALDANYFNVISEAYPTTSTSYVFNKKTGELEQKSRPAHLHTYGTWQSIKPNHRFTTFAFAKEVHLLEKFAVQQTYLLGKKRTMTQIVELGQVLAGELKQGHCQTPYLQIQAAEVLKFQSFSAMTGTMRYLLMRGETQPETSYWQFGDELAVPLFGLPDFFR